MTWSAAFAKTDITPPGPSLLSGFVARQQPSCGVHDPLYARALYLTDDTTRVAIVVLDLIGIDAELTARIRDAASAATNLPSENLALLATHTHGGPPVLPKAWLGPVDRDYRHELIDKVTATIRAAERNLQPVALTFGIGKEPNVGRNRRRAGGVNDPDVPVLRMDRSDGSPLGFLISYACHPVVLGPNNLLITRDYPGELITVLEKVLPGAEFLFLTGCCGQINTGHTAADSILGRGFGLRTFSEAARVARVLAGCALQVGEQLASSHGAPLVTPKGPLTVLRRSVTLPLSKPQPPPASEVKRWRQALAELQTSGDDPVEASRLATYVHWAELARQTTELAVETEVMLIDLGGLAFAIFPGEVFVEFGLALKRHFVDYPIITLAFGNDAPGYIPHRSAYPEGGYEIEEAFRFYGQPSVFVAEAGELLLKALSDMLNEVRSLHQ
jgi:neutral ceramidase